MSVWSRGQVPRDEYLKRLRSVLKKYGTVGRKSSRNLDWGYLKEPLRHTRSIRNKYWFLFEDPKRDPFLQLYYEVQHAKTIYVRNARQADRRGIYMVMPNLSPVRSLIQRYFPKKANP